MLHFNNAAAHCNVRVVSKLLSASWTYLHGHLHGYYSLAALDNSGSPVPWAQWFLTHYSHSSFVRQDFPLGEYYILFALASGNALSVVTSTLFDAHLTLYYQTANAMQLSQLANHPGGQISFKSNSHSTQMESLIWKMSLISNVETSVSYSFQSAEKNTQTFRNIQTVFNDSVSFTSWLIVI